MAELFLENVSEYKILEKNVMRLVLIEVTLRTVGVPEGRVFIGAPLMIENS